MERCQIRHPLHQLQSPFRKAVYRKRSCRSMAIHKLVDRRSRAIGNGNNNWECNIPSSNPDIPRDDGCDLLVQLKLQRPLRPRPVKQQFVSLFPSLKQMVNDLLEHACSVEGVDQHKSNTKLMKSVPHDLQRLCSQ